MATSATGQKPTPCATATAPGTTPTPVSPTASPYRPAVSPCRPGGARVDVIVEPTTVSTANPVPRTALTASSGPRSELSSSRGDGAPSASRPSGQRAAVADPGDQGGDGDLGEHRRGEHGRGDQAGLRHGGAAADRPPGQRGQGGGEADEAEQGDADEAPDRPAPARAGRRDVRRPRPRHDPRRADQASPAPGLVGRPAGRARPAASSGRVLHGHREGRARRGCPATPGRPTAVPPCASVRERTTARPRPEVRRSPPGRVVTNGSKTRGSTAGSMPGPSSSTTRRTSPGRRPSARTRTAVPAGVCVRALMTRASRVWVSRSSSPTSTTGAAAATPTSTPVQAEPAQPLDELLEHVGHEHRLALHRAELVAAGDRGQVADDPAEPVELAPQHLGGGPGRPGVPGPERLEDLQVAARHGQRRPQLVRHRRQQLAALLLGGREPVDHAVELVGERADLVHPVAARGPAGGRRAPVPRAAAARSASGRSARPMATSSSTAPTSSPTPPASGDPQQRVAGRGPALDERAVDPDLAQLGAVVGEQRAGQHPDRPLRGVDGDELPAAPGGQGVGVPQPAQRGRPGRGDQRRRGRARGRSGGRRCPARWRGSAARPGVASAGDSTPSTPTAAATTAGQLRRDVGAAPAPAPGRRRRVSATSIRRQVTSATTASVSAMTARATAVTRTCSRSPTAQPTSR